MKKFTYKHIILITSLDFFIYLFIIFYDWKNITIPNCNGCKLLTFTNIYIYIYILSTNVRVCPEANLFMIVLKCSHLVHIHNKTKYEILIVFIIFVMVKGCQCFCYFCYCLLFLLNERSTFVFV